MEPLWKLSYLLEPATLSLILTAVLVTFGSAFRALNYTKETEKEPLLAETIFTLNRSHALIIPVACSCTMLALFYFFSTVDQLLATLICMHCAISLHLCFFPEVFKLRSRLESTHPRIYRFLSKPAGAILFQFLVLAVWFGVVVIWLVSGNWILYNLIGISTVVVFVTHFRLPNVKVCVMLMMCLFVYDVYWVFYSERFFGSNVMDSVVNLQAISPVYTVANRLNLPGLQWVKKELELPGKIIFPKNLFGVVNMKKCGYVMLGLGDMVLPSMLLALILCFDHRKSQGTVSLLDLASSKGHKYIWYGISGYAIGVVASNAAAILTRSPQPALLYLVPSTLGPVIVVSWMRSELEELWGASLPNSNGKTHAS